MTDNPILSKSKFFPASRFAQARILLVDDYAINLKLISTKLTSVGFTNIETACDGIDALKKTYRQMPDAVLLDIMMPNMDGFGYCEQIRNDPNAAHMPIIVQTALEDRDTKIRALSSGADDFLNKPLDLEEVALRIQLHLERYFMLQDLQQVRQSLHEELELANTTIRLLEEKTTCEAGRDLLAKHYETLKTIASSSSTEH